MNLIIEYSLLYLLGGLLFLVIMQFLNILIIYDEKLIIPLLVFWIPTFILILYLLYIRFIAFVIDGSKILFYKVKEKIIRW